MRPRAMAVTCVALAALAAGPAAGQQIIVEPRVFHIDKITCGEIHALPGDQRDRVLIFLDGYVSGMRRMTTWDERAQGQLIERAMQDCKANPGDSVLSAFTRARP